jgi:predicted transposase/invertase (TIGR01784 family)
LDSKRKAVLSHLPPLLPPTSDFVFKTTLTDPEAESALRDLTASTLNIGIDRVTVRSNELYSRSEEDKQIRFDVLCETSDRKLINVEMQAKDMPGDSGANAHQELLSRLEYSVASIFSKQSSKSLAYQQIPATYQITFANFIIYPQSPVFSRHIYMRADTGETLAGKQNVYIIELPKAKLLLQKPVEEMTGLEMWAIFFAFAANTEHRALIERIGIRREAIHMADAVLHKISQSDDLRWAYFQHEMDLKDQEAGFYSSHIAGVAEGMAKGIEQGKLEGKLEGRLETARSLIKAGISIELIADATQLPVEQILREALEK